MLVDETPASHQDAPKAKTEADRAGSIAAGLSLLSYRGGLEDRQSRLRAVWFALRWSMICGSPTRISRPLRARMLHALFDAVSPDLTVRLAEHEASGNGHQIYGNRMRRQPLRFFDGRLDDRWKSEMAPASAGWPASSPGPCGCGTAIECNGP